MDSHNTKNVAAPDLSGKVIGGYQLVRMILEGGMGVVYDGIQLNLSRRVTADEEKLRAHQPQAAYDHWKTFPQNLRTKELDEQIQEVLEQNLPPAFLPR